MNYRGFTLGDWIGHISGVIEDETTLDGNEMRDLVEFLTTMQEPKKDMWSIKEVADALEKHGLLEQEPKTGSWIYTGDYITDGMLKCSECGFEHDVSERFPYCPNCGAKMKSEDKDNGICSV